MLLPFLHCCINLSLVTKCVSAHPLQHYRSMSDLKCISNTNPFIVTNVFPQSLLVTGYEYGQAIWHNSNVVWKVPHMNTGQHHTSDLWGFMCYKIKRQDTKYSSSQLCISNAYNTDNNLLFNIHFAL